MTGTNQAADKLAGKLGYKFKNPERLHTALTHASINSPENYERLEFLGDRVLSLIVAERLFELFPGESEGNLAKRHAALVQGSLLADLARTISLGDALNIAESERQSGGAENENILADTFEAVIGALYLDGGLAECRRIILNLLGSNIDVMKAPPRDPKTTLQEWAQGRGLPLPVYDLSGRDGPDHAPMFEIKVSVQGHGSASAKGSSRRMAEKEAARILLERLEGITV